MTPENILKLLKSGIWEDALIAFHMMRDWTMNDIRKHFELDHVNRYNMGNSDHIKEHLKINDHLYMIAGGVWSISFFDYPNTQVLEEDYIPLT